MKSSLAPLKCDWLLNLSQGHFGLHQEKYVKSDHGAQGPQEAYFHAYIIHWHGPMRHGFPMREAKEVLSLQCQRTMVEEMPF